MLLEKCNFYPNSFKFCVVKKNDHNNYFEKSFIVQEIVFIFSLVRTALLSSIFLLIFFLVRTAFFVKHTKSEKPKALKKI